MKATDRNGSHRQLPKQRKRLGNAAGMGGEGRGRGAGGEGGGVTTSHKVTETVRGTGDTNKVIETEKCRGRGMGEESHRHC